MLENNAIYYSKDQPIKRVRKKITERFHGGILKYVSLSYHLCLQCCLSSSIPISYLVYFVLFINSSNKTLKYRESLIM